MTTLTPRLHKFALTAHVICSVGWFGAVAGFLALAVAGLISQDDQRVRAAYLAMEVTAWFVIVPLSLAAPLTGLVMSLGTRGGLLRHYWVLAKTLITIPACILLLLHMQPIGDLARVVAETTLARGDLAGMRIQLVATAGAAIVGLLAATTLSVYKPWGRTGFGRRELEPERRWSGTRPQLNHEHTSPCLCVLDHRLRLSFAVYHPAPRRRRPWTSHRAMTLKSRLRRIAQTAHANSIAGRKITFRHRRGSDGVRRHRRQIRDPAIPPATCVIRDRSGKRIKSARTVAAAFANHYFLAYSTFVGAIIFFPSWSWSTPVTVPSLRPPPQTAS
jgi:hypothetical protein